MLRDFSFDIPIDESRVINLVADGFVCTLSNQATFGIEINDQAPAGFEQQFEYNAPPGEPIKKLRIINLSSTEQLNVKFKVWQGAFRDRRTLIDIEETLDVRNVRPDAYAKAGLEHAYLRGFQQDNFSSLGTPNPAYLLSNPANSGKTVFVEAVSVTGIVGAGTGSSYFQFYKISPTGNFGTALAHSTSGLAKGAGGDTINAISEIRQGSLPQVNSGQVWHMDPSAGFSKREFRTPIALAEREGIFALIDATYYSGGSVGYDIVEAPA